jgi:uncharacterized protein YjbI with pentapeptide repeats
MTKLIFCDFNQTLVDAVNKLSKNFDQNKWNVQLEAVCMDIFECQKNNAGYKICTAFDPDTDVVGSLGKLIANRFSSEVKNLKEFSCTHNFFGGYPPHINQKATKETLFRALTGIFAYREQNLIFSGFGIGIGGISQDDFLRCLELVLKGYTCADLDNANLSSANLSHVNLNGSNLSGAIFSGANLSYAYISGANLSYTDLSGANLSYTDLSGSDLRRTDLSRTDLTGTIFGGADLSDADLSYANLSFAKLSDADLSRANLSDADLSYTNLSFADLSFADLSGADLNGADLNFAEMSQAKNIFNGLDWLKTTFETDELGVIVYSRIKPSSVFDLRPKQWVIEPGAFIEELGVNLNPTNKCGSGVNFATLEWCKNNYTTYPLWRCRIRWIDLAAVVIPYDTEGKARCQRLELIEIVKEEAQGL